MCGRIDNPRSTGEQPEGPNSETGSAAAEGGGPEREENPREESRRRGERRSGDDRRSGLDRRGAGSRQPPSAEPRPYGFREFADRRGGQDRRLYGGDGQPWDRRRCPRDAEDELSAVLSDEEVRFLFAQSRRRP